MAKNLVIVESPAKAKTIEGYLGKDFVVKSSYGHVRDLASKGIAIEIENNFHPNYEVSPDKKTVVSDLKKCTKDADVVWLATDEDREGEAISWHLYETLNLSKKVTKRITFNEITKTAILKAIDNPREIDLHLVDAQQARRVLDRLVGFELSPVLWKKVRPSLSAGRVQSVAVRLIVEREKEIRAFNTETFFKIQGVFGKGLDKIKADITRNIGTIEEVHSLLNDFKNIDFKVLDVQTKPAIKSPSAPFTTSTLQQEASLKLGFSVSRTMTVAQKLYEAGKITYMRTDSVNFSETAMNAAKSEISRSYGDLYSNPTKYKTKSSGAQEAHEAIRPTDFGVHFTTGESDEVKLYDLIWKRSISSQMSNAKLERTTIKIGDPSLTDVFSAKGEVIKFDGFLKVYLAASLDEEEDENSDILPEVIEGERLSRSLIKATQRFSRAAPRYVEASLVKKLEELGIGRPSTYAPTISTIQKRGYVEKNEREGEERAFIVVELVKQDIKQELKTEITGKEKNKLFPTDIGIVVTDFLCAHFDRIMDYHFTAKVEEQFDEIAQGSIVWTNMLQDFYTPFHNNVTNTLEHSDRATGERELGMHPESGKKIIVRIGRFGPMVQIGDEKVDGEKPQFASLRSGQNLDNMTIESALELFKLPRDLGFFEDLPLKANVGRFGPYLQHGKAFISLKKEDDPMTVSLDRASELIIQKREDDIAKVLKVFPEQEDMQILNGRWGAYLKVGKDNVKLPKKDAWELLTYEECCQLHKNQPAQKKGSRFTKKTAEIVKDTPKKAVKKAVKKPAAKKPAAKKK